MVENTGPKSVEEVLEAAQKAASKTYATPSSARGKKGNGTCPTVIHSAEKIAATKADVVVPVATPVAKEETQSRDETVVSKLLETGKKLNFEKIKTAIVSKSNQANGEEDGSADAETPNKPKKERFKRLKAHKHWKAGVVTVCIVFVAAFAGFWVWHNTPSFCDAICHNPQDPYNPTYYAEPGESATDKWGNEVEDASSMISATHRAYGDLVCIDCHVPAIQEQVTEGFVWLTGNFYNPISERNLTNLMAYRGGDGEAFCLNESCHNMEKSDLRNATAVYARNPHEFHHFEYTCSDCHKSHRASILVCTECHEDAVAPDGWLTVEQSRNLETIYQSYDSEKM